MASCDMGGKSSSVANYEVIPLPNEINSIEEEAFILTGQTTIVYPEGNDMMHRNAEFMAEYLNIATGIKPALSNDLQTKNAIILNTGLESDNPEAYTINVNSENITINGATEAGVFYSIQTIRKATPIEKVGSVNYSSVSISDEPRFGYRGVSLDVARHFQPVEFVKKYIDLLALHK